MGIGSQKKLLLHLKLKTLKKNNILLLLFLKSVMWPSTSLLYFSNFQFHLESAFRATFISLGHLWFVLVLWLGCHSGHLSNVKYLHKIKQASYLPLHLVGKRLILCLPIKTRNLFSFPPCQQEMNYPVQVFTPSKNQQ